jgi:hypothetical protein
LWYEWKRLSGFLDLLTEKTVKVLPVGKTPHAMAATATGKIFVNNDVLRHQGGRDIPAHRIEAIPA